MKYIDLHVHSNASDGTLPPGEVVHLAVQKGLAAIALTDHDTILGIPEAQKAAVGHPIEIIPGIELSCDYQGTEIHILGLYVDPYNPVFCNELKGLVSIREARNDEMISLFQENGICISRKELTLGNPDTVITRAHFAKVLVEKGYAPGMRQAFKKYLQYGSRFCPHKKPVTMNYAMGVLTACGAFPILAHPYQYKLGDAGIEKLVEELKEMGLQGIEVYHSSHNQYESGKLKTLAVKHLLLPTGGSDFHGANKPDIGIGTGRGGLKISYLLLEDIKKQRNHLEANQSSPHQYNVPAQPHNR